MALAARPSFQNEQVQAALREAFPAPTFKIHLVDAKQALLLKLAEHELRHGRCGCFSFRAPAARTFEELSPETAQHQWTLGIDGDELTCVRKCGAEGHDPVRDGPDLEQDSVMQRLQWAVVALHETRWFLDESSSAPSFFMLAVPDQDVLALPSFENARVQAILEEAFPAPTFKVHVVRAEQALLLKLAEHELQQDRCDCLCFRAPAARSHEELSPQTATHQWTLGIDGNELTCVRKCGGENFDLVRDGLDLEQESVTRKLPQAAIALRQSRWGAVQAAMPRKENSDASLSSTQAESSAAPLSVSCGEGSLRASSLDVAPAQQSMLSQASGADELRKLADLVKEGLLSDQEFQVHQKRLLAEPLI